MRAGLEVVEALRPVLGVLTEKLLEGGEQLDDVQTAIGIDIPGGVLRKSYLGGPGQLPRDGLGVDWIGDAQRAFVGNESQVPDVLDVAVPRPADERRPDDRLELVVDRVETDRGFVGTHGSRGQGPMRVFAHLPPPVLTRSAGSA